MMLKNIFSAFLFLSICQYCFSQDQAYIDSLVMVLQAHNTSKTEQSKTNPTTDDTTAVILMLKIAGAYQYIDPTATMDYAKKSLALAEQIGYKKGIGEAYNMMGISSERVGDNLAGLEFHSKALRIREEINDQSGIAGSLNNLGTIYMNQGDIPQALQHFFSALKMNEASGNKLWQCINVNGIGNAYESTGQYKEALRFYTDGLHIAESLENKRFIGTGYVNIGNLYYRQGIDAEALKNYLVALTIFEETGNRYAQSLTLNNIGLIYKEEGRYPEAMAQFKTALSISEEIQDKSNILSCFLFIGDTYFLQKHFQLATSYLERALLLGKETGEIDRIKDTYLNLSELNTEQGKFEQALNHFKLYITFRDSLVNEEQTKEAVELQMQYDFDKQQVADSLTYAREKEVGTLKLQRQKVITYTGFAGAALILLFLYIVYQSYQKQKLANHQLKVAQDQLIKTEKMAAFGVMASRVSHEILNPLNFVNNFSELSQDIVTDVLTSDDETEKKESADQLIANLKKINEHGKRASAIVKELQEHSLKGSAHTFFEEDKG